MGIRIKALRLAKGLTQQELAEKIGLDRSKISQIENNEIIPSVRVVKNIAIALGCTTDYIILGKESEK